MKQYQELMTHVLNNGAEKADRTGTGTLSIFGHQSRYDLQAGFPLVTTKKCHLRSIIHELLWFLKGETNIQYLKENKVRIWDEWADAEGNLGRVYGAQWRSWQRPDGSHVDQVKENLLRTPRPFPKLIFKCGGRDSIYDYKYEDVKLIDYCPYKNIKAPMAV